MKEIKFTRIELEDLEKSFLNNSKYISHEIQENYIYYKKKYFNKSVFKNLSFQIKKSDNIVICPLTLEKKEEGNKINFFGEPIRIFSTKTLDDDLNKFLIDYFKELKKEYSLADFLFKIKNNEDSSTAEKNSYKVGGDIFINLRLELDEMKKYFDGKLRNELKKDNKDLEFVVIDSKNYQKNEILKMRDLHISVSGRETRSKDSWIANEKMILDDSGFLIKVLYKKKIISYNLFYFNKETCVYFSSCTLREYFNEVKNIGDKTIWKAIKFSKERSKNFKRFIWWRSKYSSKIYNT